MLEKVKSDLTTLCLQRPHLEAHLTCLLHKLPLNQEQNTASENDNILWGRYTLHRFECIVK